MAEDPWFESWNQNKKYNFPAYIIVFKICINTQQDKNVFYQHNSTYLGHSLYDSWSFV